MKDGIRSLNVKHILAVHMLSTAVLGGIAGASMQLLSFRYSRFPRWGVIVFFPLLAVWGLTLVRLLREAAAAGARGAAEAADGRTSAPGAAYGTDGPPAAHRDPFTWTDRIPPELLYLGALMAFFAGITVVWYLYYELFHRYFPRLILILCGLMLYVPFLEAALSTARRLGAGTLGKSSLCCRVLRRAAALWRGAKAAFRGHTTLAVRTGIALVILFAVQAFFVAAADADGLVPFFLVYKVLETVFVMRFVLQLQRLREGAMRLAGGRTDVPVAGPHMCRPLREQAEALDSIADGMEAALDERMKSERMRTELIANVSHDLRTPLTSIINYIDLMGREEISEPRVREYREIVERQAVRLKKLTTDLIDASRASSGNLDVELAACDLGVMLQQSLGEWSARLEERDITPVLTMPAGAAGGTGEQEAAAGVNVLADGRYLSRVIDNLLENVYKYAMPGTRLYLDVQRADGRVQFVCKNVSRERLNVDPEELKERFVRGDRARNSAAEGSGLGLSIAESLTKLMRGDLVLTIDGDLFKAVLDLEDAGAGPA